MWRNTFPAEPSGPRSMIFREPLESDAPPTAQAYCCYTNTVIFYEQPYRTLEDGTSLAEHGRAETQWDLLGQKWTDQDLGWGSLAPLVEHEGQIYELGGGGAVWEDGRWVMQWIGWRLPADDRKLLELKRLGWDR